MDLGYSPDSRCFYIPAGLWHLKGDLLWLEIKVRRCINSDTYRGGSYANKKHVFHVVVWRWILPARDEKSLFVRCHFIPPLMDLEGYSLKVTFWQCCIPDDLPLPSDVSASLLSTALSLPVTAASLSSLPLSSGSGAAGSCAQMEEGAKCCH